MLLIKILLCLPITLGKKFIILNTVFKASHQLHLMSFSLSILTFLPASSLFISSKMSIFFLPQGFHALVSSEKKKQKKSHIHLSDITLNITCSQGSHLTTKQYLFLLFFYSFFTRTCIQKMHISKE